MTRKHFIAIARCVAKIGNAETRRTLAADLADEFAKANKDFDRDRFLQACAATA